MEFGSRYNADRQEMTKLERAAISNSVLLKNHRVSLTEKQNTLVKATESLRKAVLWRAQMLKAMRGTFCIPGPLKIGSTGILGCVTVQQVVSDRCILVKFNEKTEVDGERRASKTGDGIVTVKVWVKPVNLVVKDFDASRVTPGQKLKIDSVFEVTKEKLMENLETFYFVQPLDHPLSKLFAAIKDVQDPLPVPEDDELPAADVVPADPAAATPPPTIRKTPPVKRRVPPMRQ